MNDQHQLLDEVNTIIEKIRDINQQLTYLQSVVKVLAKNYEMVIKKMTNNNNSLEKHNDKHTEQKNF